jgi:hypothetical protein
MRIKRWIIAIEWRPELQIDVAYSSGPAECLVGTRAMAAEVAREVGLSLALAPKDAIRWEAARSPVLASNSLGVNVVGAL